MISIDKKLFETEEEFVNFINGLEEISDEKKLSLIEHEKAHFNKAVELNCSPQYGYKETLIGPLFGGIIRIRKAYVESNVPRNKLYYEREILNAPKDPTIFDKAKGILFYKIF